jgi:dTMP kinase
MLGRFITFEGGEGAGKSTQIERLRRRLEGAGRDVLVTREPGGSPKAEEIRRFLLEGRAKGLGIWAETLLFAAARVDHLDKTIRPALDRGTHVLCDRFADSTRAYQGGVGGADGKLLASLERVTVGESQPNLTFVLDLPVEIGLERARQRREVRNEAVDRFESEDVAFHQALRQAFLEIARSQSHRCEVIDATRDVDTVEADIWSALARRVPELADRPKEDADHG